MKKKIRFRHLGRKDRLPKELIEKMAKLEEDTKNFTEYNFSIALDYGGRDELLRAFDKLKKSGNEITEENISKYLDTNGLPDPDLIIRTGGEQRYSGIMPWQGVYSEFYFCPLYFPDFTPEELTLVMGDFCSRHRRYGK